MSFVDSEKFESLYYKHSGGDLMDFSSLIDFSKEFIEQYEESKWIPFDSQNPETWPLDESLKNEVTGYTELILKGNQKFPRTNFTSFTEEGAKSWAEFGITHWKPL